MLKKTTFLPGAGIAVIFGVLILAGCPGRADNRAAEPADPSFFIGTWINDKKGSLTIYEDYSFSALINYTNREFGVIGFTKTHIPVTGIIDFSDSTLIPHDCILKDLRVYTRELEVTVQAMMEDALIRSFIAMEPNFSYTYASLAENSEAKEVIRQSILERALERPESEMLVRQVEEAMDSMKNIPAVMNLERATFMPLEERTKFTVSSQNQMVQKFFRRHVYQGN